MITNFDKAFEKVAEIRYRKKQHDAVKTYDISFYQIAFEFDRIIFSVTNKCPPLDKIFGEDAFFSNLGTEIQISKGELDISSGNNQIFSRIFI
ncbi:unnamed protein product [Rotaria sordida]|uniref:Uncharacterized protein n=1 Tax=Rotaria sordida TaxID=392033 RepID=A0A819F8J0_9BILA|nr:unnamed protein product [Rotaria sordida]